MADQPASEKVLPASLHKLQKAREKGNVARSADLNSGVLLLAAALGLYALGPFTFAQLIGLMRYYFTDAATISVEPGDMQSLLAQVLLFAAPVVFPLMLVLMATGILINVTQIGFIFSSQALQPKLERLDPIRGFKRFLSLRSLVELTKSIAKLSVIGYIAVSTVQSRSSDILELMHSSPWAGGIAVWNVLFAVWWRVALAMILIGLLDFAFQRWQYLQDQRMTRQEAQDELKQLEGDPRIKQRVRQIQRQMAMQRMMADVPEAEVVITNPTAYAVALRYEPAKMEAPRVVAKGARRVAERIRELAVENDVPIVERPELARALFRDIEIGGHVPESLFKAVAEILAYVYEIERRESKIAERIAVV